MASSDVTIKAMSKTEKAEKSPEALRERDEDEEG